jgi:hypothetical protein
MNESIAGRVFGGLYRARLEALGQGEVGVEV